METHEIVVDGKKYAFQVLKNTTEPCPQCGVPACGREDILWYEHENQRMAIIFDGGYFDMARDEFYERALEKIEFDSLPNFMQEWNELRGWEECWDYDGYELQIDDFLQSMELLKSCEMGKWITTEDINDMQELAKTALEKGAKLKIVRG